jgi:hypothetical protein
MSDGRLREFERSLAAGADPEAGARLLAERLRAGTLDRERLRLAAYVGDAAARLLVETEPEPDLRRWAGGLREWGPEPCARAAVVAARLALVGWESWEPGSLEPGRVLCDALESAIESRQRLDESLHRSAHESAANALDRTAQHLASLEAEHGLVLTRAWRAHRCGLAMLTAAQWVVDPLRHVAACADGKRRDIGWAVWEVADALADATGVRAAIRVDMAPWALA